MTTQPRLNKDDAYSEKWADGTQKYFRTGKGSHRHASFYCANGKRSIFTGDVFPIPADEAKDWAACLDCCSDADKAESIAKEQAKLDAQCPNNKGVIHPQRIYSSCRVCGKEGKVQRGTGSIRAHKPTTEPSRYWVAMQQD